MKWDELFAVNRPLLICAVVGMWLLGGCVGDSSPQPDSGSVPDSSSDDATSSGDATNEASVCTGPIGTLCDGGCGNDSPCVTATGGCTCSTVDDSGTIQCNDSLWDCVSVADCSGQGGPCCLQGATLNATTCPVRLTVSPTSVATCPGQGNQCGSNPALCAGNQDCATGTCVPALVAGWSSAAIGVCQ